MMTNTVPSTRLLGWLLLVFVSPLSFVQQAASQLVTVQGDPCVDLLSGDGNERLGQACVEIEGENVVFSVTSKELCTLMEAHLCNLPYSSGEIEPGTTELTIVVPIDEAFEFVCGYDDTNYLVAGHLDLMCADDGVARTVQAYFELELQCDGVLVAGNSGRVTPPDLPPEEQCRQAFATTTDNGICSPNLEEGENCSTCFQHIRLDDDPFPQFFRWGWVNGPISPPSTDLVSYEFPLYASATDCDTSLGDVVGNVQVEIAINGAVYVTYDTSDSEFVLSEVHLYVGTDQLPIDVTTGEITIRPGDYPVIEEDLARDTYVLFIPRVLDTKFTSDVYIIAHAIVCPEGGGGIGDQCIPPFRRRRALQGDTNAHPPAPGAGVCLDNGTDGTQLSEEELCSSKACSDFGPCPEGQFCFETNLCFGENLKFCGRLTEDGRDVDCCYFNAQCNDDPDLCAVLGRGECLEECGPFP